MARETVAGKKRKKMRIDPTTSRGTFGDIDPFERKTPTLRLRQDRKENKYKNKRIWEESDRND